MSKYRNNLPQLKGDTFLTDGGLETTLIFHEGLELPCFAAFDLLTSREGRKVLEDYFRRYAEIAARNGVGFVFETPTWRASADWGTRLGYSAEALQAVNEDAIELLAGLRDEFERAGATGVVSGNVGPRGDGYRADTTMTAEEAQAYHAAQIGALAAAGADMITALTMTYPEEAIGIARASAAAGLPCAIGFTVETDGRLPGGHTIGGAIEAVDAASGVSPAYYMINCAHPSHFADALRAGAGWLERIHGIRANASKKSHAELDNSDTLDDGDPGELGGDYRELMRLLPALNVFGGCCGTDHRHVAAMCDACAKEHAA